jgi:hypothetical protein
MSATRETGDVVTIYGDPLTEQKPEGKATLVRFEGAIGEYDNREIEMWVVRFLSEPDQTFERQLLTPGTD